MKKSILGAALAACAITIAGCDDARRAPPIPPTATGNLLLLTDNNELASVNVEFPALLISKESIKGLKTGDSLVGLDYRPSDAQLYAIGYLGNIYTIDTTTTTATFEKALIPDPADTTAPFTAISGDKSQIAVNFDPLTDRLRLVGSNGQNLRIDVDTGKTTTDAAINGADATVTSIAHTNSFPETKTTRLFDIDVKQDRLFLQGSPNDGTLSTSAALGVTATGSSGFAINGFNNKGYAVLTVNGSQRLYSINLSSIGTTTNAATLAGSLPTLGNIHAIALKSNIHTTTYQAAGLTNNNKLALFDLADPTDVLLVNISGGLATDESIIGIDYRPSKPGVLYALSNKGYLYIFTNPNTGTLSTDSTKKIKLIANETDTTQPFTALDGTRFAMDFDPVADSTSPTTPPTPINSLRVISNTGQNLRVDVDTGKTITDTNLNGIPSALVTAAAYSNNFKSTGGTTQLFNLERSTSKLALQASPNDGTLTAVGALGITLGNATGLDIVGGDNGLALAVANVGEANTSSLYKVNLTTGEALPAVSVNGTPDPAKSKIGNNTTPVPALIDIALLQAQ